MIEFVKLLLVIAFKVQTLETASMTYRKESEYKAKLSLETTIPYLKFMAINSKLELNKEEEITEKSNKFNVFYFDYPKESKVRVEFKGTCMFPLFLLREKNENSYPIKIISDKELEMDTMAFPYVSEIGEDIEFKDVVSTNTYIEQLKKQSHDVFKGFYQGVIFCALFTPDDTNFEFELKIEKIKPVVESKKEQEKIKDSIIGSPEKTMQKDTHILSLGPNQTRNYVVKDVKDNSMFEIRPHDKVKATLEFYKDDQLISVPYDNKLMKFNDVHYIDVSLDNLTNEELRVEIIVSYEVKDYLDDDDDHYHHHHHGKSFTLFLYFVPFLAFIVFIGLLVLFKFLIGRKKGKKKEKAKRYLSMKELKKSESQEQKKSDQIEDYFNKEMEFYKEDFVESQETLDQNKEKEKETAKINKNPPDYKLY